METVFGNYPQSRSLPQVVSEDRQTSPDGGPCRALCQHSTQAELAFEHTDRGFYAAAKSLQLPKPLRLLMPLFFPTQATHFRNADFLNTGLAKFQYVIGTVVAPIGGEIGRLYAEAGFCPSHHRKQFGAVAGVAPVNLIVKDDSGTILHQLQGAPKLYRLVKFPFANGPCFTVVEGNDPLQDRFLSLKLLLGLLHNGLGQLNLLKKPPLELSGLIRHRLQRLAALSQGVFSKLSHFFEDFSSLLFAFLGISLGRLTPAKKRPLTGPHVAGDLLTQRASRAGKRVDRLVNHSDIVGVADVSLKGGRVDPNPARLDRSSLQQLLDQMLIEACDPIAAKSLIELDQCRRVGDWIHQGKPAEIPPR